MLRPTTKGIACALALTATGCVSFKLPPPVAIIEADEAMVQGCTFLGTLSQSEAGSWGDADSVADRAKAYARQKAVGLGATHIVFDRVEKGAFWKTAKIQARAYRCEAKP